MPKRALSPGLICAGLLVGGSALAGSGADSVLGVKGGDAWRRCENYFNHVQAYKRNNRHYDIRDASFEFLNSVRLIKVGNRKERFLLIECVNLATGNATHSSFMIAKEQKESEQFFKMALNDAINNSNAHQAEYMSKIDGQFNLSAEIEAGKEEFRNRIIESRRAALMTLAQGMQITSSAFLGNAGYYNGEFGYNSAVSLYGHNGSAVALQAFVGVANIATRTYTRFSVPRPPAGGGLMSGGTGFKTQKTLSYTPALLPKSGAQGSAPAPGRTVMRTPTAPPAAETSAPRADPHCLVYKAGPAYEPFAEITNRCEYPIQWRWCWIQRGKDSCTPDQLSKVVKPGASALVDGPTGREKPKASFFVCDMSEQGKYCSR